jgi:ribosomal protein L37E
MTSGSHDQSEQIASGERAEMGGKRRRMRGLVCQRCGAHAEQEHQATCAYCGALLPHAAEAARQAANAAETPKEPMDPTQQDLDPVKAVLVSVLFFVGLIILAASAIRSAG